MWCDNHLVNDFILEINLTRCEEKCEEKIAKRYLELRFAGGPMVAQNFMQPRLFLRILSDLIGRLVPSPCGVKVS